MPSSKHLSTSALSKSLGLTSKVLFDKLEFLGWISKDRELTPEGMHHGGEYKEHPKFGKYIAWPESIQSALPSEELHTAKSHIHQSSLTSKTIGQHFELSANKINHILSELGWIEKSLKGWKITKQGIKVGATQCEDYRSGVPYVRWPDDIIANKSLLETIDNLQGNIKEPRSLEETKKEFRDKFKANYRTTDGHQVRSKAEMLIDNWLYMAEIVHAYERKLPIEEDVYCDFYIPTGKVYIEFWGLENEPKYLERKKKKIEIYNKYGFNLIELNDYEVQNLDDHLPRLLLKFGIQSY